jgi:hypothetical protein
MIPGALALSLAMNCAPTVLDNRTEVWSVTDQKSATSASERCSVYYEDSPCLVRFTKTEENVYRAICGERGEE